MGRKEKSLILALLGAVAALWLVFTPGCPFRNMTGIPCPGCGMTRAWLSALALDFPRAMEHHPLFWSVPVFFLLFWLDFRPFRRQLWNVLLIAGLTAALLLCWRIRLYFGLIQ